MSIKNSFSARLSLNIMFFTSILFIVTIAIAAVSSHTLISEEATKNAQNLRDKAIVEIERTLQGVEASANTIAWLVREHLDDPDYFYHITKRIVTENPNIYGSAVAFTPNFFKGNYFYSPYTFLNQDGEIEQKQLGNPQYDYFCMDWFQIPYLMGEPCWSEPYFDEGGGNQLMSTYSYPVKDENGQVIAVMTADITMDWISDILKDIKPYPSSSVLLISRCGQFINLADSSSRFIGHTVYSLSDYLGGTAASDAIMSNSTQMRKFSFDKEDYFIVFGPIDNGWRVLISCEYKDVLEKTAQMRFVLILLAIFGLTVLFFLCYRTVKRLTKPLSDFTASALSIAQGNFNTELPQIQSKDEILQLRNSFDHMQKSINEYIRNLKASTAANERFESELNIASKIQMAMLPRNFPSRKDFELYASLAPAREVGGDLYDFFIKGDYAYFAIGDVSGKGVPASLFMAITRACFRFIAGLGLSMDKVVSSLNDSVSESNESGMFVTFFAARLNLRTGELEYCNAGHNPSVLIDPDGNTEFMDVKPNLALGLFPEFPYVSQTMTIRKGCAFVLYTDGVTEAEKQNKDQYSEERLIGWATRAYKDCGSAKEACEDLLDSVHAFTEDNEQNDDITVVTVKYC